MTKEALTEKIKKTGRDCTTCEFCGVPARIEPCRSCGETNNWTEDKRKK